jgi:hypothetical protein
MFDKNMGTHKSFGTYVETAEFSEGLRKYMMSIYNYMAAGLLVSALTAFALASMPGLQSIFYGPTPDGRMSFTLIGLITAFAPLGIILYASFNRKMSTNTLQGLYWLFVALQVVDFSVLLQI